MIWGVKEWFKSRIKPKLRIRGEGIIDRVDGYGRVRGRKNG